MDTENSNLPVPKREDTFKKYSMIYKDHLTGKPLFEIAKKYKLARTTIYTVISTMARYCDLELENNMEIQVARDRANLRIKDLRKYINEARKSDDYKAVASLMREIRTNEELVHKLDGLLKIKFEQHIDKSQNIIVHNMGSNADPQALPDGKTVDLSLKGTVANKNPLLPEALTDFEPIEVVHNIGVKDNGTLKKRNSRDGNKKPVKKELAEISQGSGSRETDQ